MSEAELEKKIVIGEYVQRKRSTLVETVYAILKEVRKNA
jgi:hypothetical protein